MVKKLLLAGVFVFGVLAMPGPALAVGTDGGGHDVDPEICVLDLLDCCEKAAKIEGFWAAWVAALDCEFEFTKCAGWILIVK
jgi:hypothetical protein